MSGEPAQIKCARCTTQVWGLPGDLCYGCKEIEQKVARNRHDLDRMLEECITDAMLRRSSDEAWAAIAKHFIEAKISIMSAFEYRRHVK